MEASHKTHRPHIKVGKDEEEEEDLSVMPLYGPGLEDVSGCVYLVTMPGEVKDPTQVTFHGLHHS